MKQFSSTKILLGPIGLCLALVAGGPAQAAKTDGEKTHQLMIGGSLTGQYLAGRFAHRTQDYNAAQRYFRSVGNAYPDNPLIQRQSMVVSILDGNIEGAIPMAKRLLELQPGAPIANLLLAAVDLRAEEMGKVLARATETGGQGSIRAIMPLYQAWALAGQGKTDEALRILEQSSRNKGMAALASLHEGMILEFAGRTGDAINAYKKSATLDNGLTFRGAMLLADLYRRQGDHAAMRGVYERYQKEHPQSLLIKPFIEMSESSGEPPVPVTAADGMAEAMFSVASSLRRGRDQEAALMFGRLALYLRSDFPVAQLLVAELLEDMKNYEQANAIYLTIDDSSPFAWTARVRAASNLDRIDKTEEAIRQLEKLAERHKTRFDVRVELADILRVRSRFAESAAVYDEAMGLMDDPTKDYGWTIYYYRGITLERSKQWDRAEKDFLKALEMEPDQPLVLNYLGYSWVEQGKNLDRARKMIEQAVAQRPRDGYIVDSLGWVLYRLGDIEGAVKHLERAVELLPGDPIINDHLGDVYWLVDRKLEARFQWQRALTLKPQEAEMIDEIKKKLRVGLDPEEKG